MTITDKNKYIPLLYFFEIDLVDKVFKIVRRREFNAIKIRRGGYYSYYKLGRIKKDGIKSIIDLLCIGNTKSYYYSWNTREISLFSTRDYFGTGYNIIQSPIIGAFAFLEGVGYSLNKFLYSMVVKREDAESFIKCYDEEGILDRTVLEFRVREEVMINRKYHKLAIRIRKDVIPFMEENGINVTFVDNFLDCTSSGPLCNYKTLAEKKKLEFEMVLSKKDHILSNL